jgi:hypothetical protein
MNIKITELLKEAKELDESFLMTDIKELEELVETNKATIASVAFKRLRAKINGIAEAQLIADVEEASAQLVADVQEASAETDEATEYEVVYSETDDDGTLEIAEITNLDEVGEETNVQVEVEPVPEPVQDETGTVTDDAAVENEAEQEIEVLELVDTDDDAEDTVTVPDDEDADSTASIVSKLDAVQSPSAMLSTVIDEAHMLDVSCAEVALKAEADNLGSVNDADHFERGEAIDTQLIALEVSNALDIVKRAKDNVGKPVSIDEAKSAAEIVDALREDEIISHVNIAKVAVVNARNVQAIKKSNDELYRALVSKLAEVQKAVTEAGQMLQDLTK